MTVTSFIHGKIICQR